MLTEDVLDGNHWGPSDQSGRIGEGGIVAARLGWVTRRPGRSLSEVDV